jgi:RNA polymerase sigma-70 factor (ECF subfamily)
MSAESRALQESNHLSDEDVVARVCAGERGLFEVVMRRYNQRIYRAVRAITGNDGEAEDVMQDAYTRAYAHLDQFAGRASFATWLTRIAVHEALARRRRSARFVNLDEVMPALAFPGHGPEQRAIDRELGAGLQTAVDELPPIFRVVFVLREVEGLSTAETAECLGIPSETVKTRLHRARSLLRHRLWARAGSLAGDVFQFGAGRCDRVVVAVLARIADR